MWPRTSHERHLPFRTTRALAPCTGRSDLGCELARDQDRRDDGTADLVRLSALWRRDGLSFCRAGSATRTGMAAAIGLETDPGLRRVADGRLLLSLIHT